MNDESIAVEPFDPGGVMQRKCLLVLGMHRSGTSALSGLLSILGCELPRKVRDPKEDNPKGFFESHPISRFNESVFKSAGTSWDDWQVFNEGWYDSPVFEDYLKQATSLILEEFQGSNLIVNKDPRICRLVPFWIRALHEAGYESLVVHIVRNPLEVAQSLKSRNNFEPSLSMLIWLRYNLDAEFHSRRLRRTLTTYHSVLSGWTSQANKIQDVLEIKLPRVSTRAEIDIDNFLSPNLRHYNAKPADLLDATVYSEWIRDSFGIFERWSKGGEDCSDFERLDQINRDFTNAAPAFAHLIEAGRSAKVNEKKGKEFEENWAASQREVHLQKQLNSDLQEKNESLEIELSAVQVQKNELEQKLTALEVEKIRVDRKYKEHLSKYQSESFASLERIDELNRHLQTRHNELACLARLQIKTSGEHETCEVRLKDRAEAARLDLLACIADIGRQYLLLGRVAFFRDRKILKNSILFDEDWYLREYQDVKDAGLDPVSHYLLNGCGEGRDPSQDFKSLEYYQRNRDVLLRKMNALVHYVRYGQFEDRR